MIIPVFKPSIQRKEMDYVLSCLVSDEIGPGKLKQDLAKELSGSLAARGGEMFREFTQAVRSAYEAIGLEPEQKILMSGLTPAPYFEVAQQMGLHPLVCDVDPATGGIDPASAEPFLEQEPSAVVLFHGAGTLTPGQSVKDWEIPIIEDISSVYGATSEEQTIGVWGDCLVLRMESSDMVTCGGGTGVFAKTPKTWKNLKESSKSLPGTALLADMNAALGLAQLISFEKYLNRRREIQDIYVKAAMKSRHKRLVALDGWESSAYTFPVVLDASVSEVRQYCRKKGCEVDLIFHNSVILLEDLSEAACPNARSLAMRTMVFPLYPGLGGSQVTAVSKILSTLP